jgi:hypothetical protein
VTESPTGWYQDDDDPTLARWWDGERWTEHTIALGDDMAGAADPLGWPEDEEQIDAPDDYQNLAAEELFPDLEETLLAPAPPSRTRFPRPIEGLPVPGGADEDAVDESLALGRFEEESPVLDPTTAFLGLGALGALSEDDDLPFGPDATVAGPAHRRRDDGFAERAGRWPLSSGLAAALVAVLVIAAAAVGSYVIFHNSGSDKKDASTTSTSTTQVTFIPLSPGSTDTTSTTLESTSTTSSGATATTVRRSPTTTRPRPPATTAPPTTAPPTTAPPTTAPPTTTPPTTSPPTTDVGTTGGPGG